MRVFKTKEFARSARRETIRDATLLEAASRAERGLIDADLGGGLIKQRVARPGQGRRSGYRTLMAFRAGGPDGVRLWLREERTRQYRAGGT